MSYDFNDFESTPSDQGNQRQNSAPREEQREDRSYPGQNGGQYSKPAYSTDQQQQSQGGQQQQSGGHSNGQQRQEYQGNSNGNQHQRSGGNYNDRSGGNGGNSGSWQANKGGFNKGGGNGGGNGFQRKEPDPNATIYLPYAVLGNDNVPPHVVDIVRKVGQRLDKMGYTCRTGGMKGFEETFENAVERKEVHLPWKDFDQKQSKFTYTPPDAKIIAARYQPGFDALKPFIQSFLAKNVRVLMGKDLKGPSLFLITWSEDGAETTKERTARTGNAGHAIAIAHHLRIPIFNLGKEGTEGRLHSYLTMHEHENDPQAIRN